MYWWWIRWRILWWNDDKYYEDYLYECDEEYNNVIDDDYRIDELIDSLDEEILKDVLKYLLENNSSARRSFLKYINNEDDNINIENLINVLMYFIKIFLFCFKNITLKVVFTPIILF